MADLAVIETFCYYLSLAVKSKTELLNSPLRKAVIRYTSCKNDSKMKDRIHDIYTFLIENRQFNHSLQDKFYKSVISPYRDTSEKVISLLYHIANTQSQPKIDSLASFYKSIYEDNNCMTSMKTFIDKINPNQPLSFESLFKGMKKQDGWGNKTAALFT